MRFRRVFIVGGVLLGFLLGLSLLVAVVLLGYRAPWRTMPKKQNQAVPHKTTQSSRAQLSPGHPVQSGAAPFSIALAARAAGSADVHSPVYAQQPGHDS